MIIIAGTFDFEPADREAFLEATVELVRASNAEEGCHAYTFAADPHDAGRVWLYELWDDNTLDRHRDTPHYKTFGPILANAKAKTITVRQFNAVEVPR
jgi:quinol monooxygenase YgiN